MILVTELPQSAKRVPIAFIAEKFDDLAQDFSVLSFGQVLSCEVSDNRISRHMMSGDLPAFDYSSSRRNKKRDALCFVHDEYVEFPTM